MQRASNLAVSTGQLRNRLDEQLQNFVKEHLDTSPIIINTLQNIRKVGDEKTAMPAITK